MLTWNGSKELSKFYLGKHDGQIKRNLLETLTDIKYVMTQTMTKPPYSAVFKFDFQPVGSLDLNMRILAT